MPELQELREDIQELVREMAAAQERLQIFTQLFQEEKHVAQSYRQDMRIALSATSESVRTLVQKLDAMEPQVKTMFTAYQHGLGVASVGKYVWVGLIAIGTFVLGAGGVLWLVLKHFIEAR